MANRRGGEIDKKYWFVCNACSKTIEAGESTIASIRLEVLFFFLVFIQQVVTGFQSPPLSAPPIQQQRLVGFVAASAYRFAYNDGHVRQM